MYLDKDSYQNIIIKIKLFMSVGVHFSFDINIQFIFEYLYNNFIS